MNGHYPGGTQLTSEMPRWNIGNEHPADPIAFLKTLSQPVEPGARWRQFVQDSSIAAPRSRNALPITEAELRLIASAAIIGDSSQPVKG